MTTTSRIRLAGSGWRREVDLEDVRLLIEKLRANDQWNLAHRLSERLAHGGELSLAREERRALFIVLEDLRAIEELPTRLSMLCSDLDDDLYGYES